jgi:hypothetical protein
MTDHQLPPAAYTDAALDTLLVIARALVAVDDGEPVGAIETLDAITEIVKTALGGLPAPGPLPDTTDLEALPPRALITMSVALSPDLPAFADTIHAGNTLLGALVHTGMADAGQVHLVEGVDAEGVTTRARWAEARPEDYLR